MRKLRLLVPALVAILVAPAPAHANVPDKFGFATWQGGVVTDMFPGGSITPTAVIGRTQVIFTGQAAPANTGIVHVTAINREGHWCQVATWGPLGADERIFVDCYDQNGMRARTDFTVMFSKSSPPISGAGKYAYVDYNGGIVSQFNSTAGFNGVTALGGSRWRVFVPNIVPGNVQVTAVNAAAGFRCKIESETVSGSHSLIVVKCFNALGVPQDTRWTFSQHYQRKVWGDWLSHSRFGYVTVQPPGLPMLVDTVGETNFNSLAGPDINDAVPNYHVKMPLIFNSLDHAQVTAFGEDNKYCNFPVYWANPGANDLLLHVICFRQGGVQTNSGFSATYAARF